MDKRITLKKYRDLARRLHPKRVKKTPQNHPKLNNTGINDDEVVISNFADNDSSSEVFNNSQQSEQMVEEYNSETGRLLQGSNQTGEEMSIYPIKIEQSDNIQDNITSTRYSEPEYENIKKQNTIQEEITTKMSIQDLARRRKAEKNKKITAQESKKRQKPKIQESESENTEDDGKTKMITVPLNDFISLVNNVKMMMSKLENIEELLQKNGQQCIFDEPIVDDVKTELPLMPFEDVGPILEFDSNLKTNRALAKKFIYQIHLMEAPNYKKATRNIMASIMTDNVCSQVTWVGTQGTIRMSNTRIAHLIVQVITRNYGCKVSNVQDIIKDWLRRFGDRQHRLGIIPIKKKKSRSIEIKIME